MPGPVRNFLKKSEGCQDYSEHLLDFADPLPLERFLDPFYKIHPLLDIFLALNTLGLSHYKLSPFFQGLRFFHALRGRKMEDI